MRSAHPTTCYVRARTVHANHTSPLVITDIQLRSAPGSRHRGLGTIGIFTMGKRPDTSAQRSARTRCDWQLVLFTTHPTSVRVAKTGRSRRRSVYSSEFEKPDQEIAPPFPYLCLKIKRQNDDTKPQVVNTTFPHLVCGEPTVISKSERETALGGAGRGRGRVDVPALWAVCGQWPTVNVVEREQVEKKRGQGDG